MNSRRQFLTFVALVLVLAGCAYGEDSTPPILFAAYAVEAKLTLFSLKMTTGDRTAAKWVTLHDEYSGYALSRFDLKTEELILTQGTKELRLKPVYSQNRTGLSEKKDPSSAPGMSPQILSREEAKAYFESLIARLLAEAKKMATYKPYDPEYEKHLSREFQEVIDAARKRAEEKGSLLFAMEVRGKPGYYNYVPIEKKYPEAMWKNLSAGDLRDLNFAAAFAGTEWNIALGNAGLI